MADSILKFPDRLRIEGVMAKGYGIICKYPMQDTDLDIAAKAVYSLLCALAGDDHSVFPSRDKIVSWLNVGRNKYNAGMRQLRDQGYILVEQVKGVGSRFAHNSYTIVSNPKKFAEQKYDSDGGALTFGFTGLKGAGYGLLPRMVMFDQRLSCTAKVIYAYLASYSGAGQVSFPKVSVICRHLGLSENSFRKHMKQLVDTNYISRVQRHINGRLASNSYHLNDCPDMAAADKGRTIVVQYPKNSATVQSPKIEAAENQPAVKQSADIQPTAEQATENQSAGFQSAVPEATTIISSLNNIPLSNNPSINRRHHWTDGMTLQEIEESIGEGLELELYTPEMKTSFGITMSDAAIQQFIGIIAGYIYSRKPELKVRGRTYTRDEVICRLMGLSLEEYQAVYEQVSRVNTPIKDRRKYILASLVTIREDLDLAVEMDVQRDFGQSS